jgi:hypothetical protein
MGTLSISHLQRAFLSHMSIGSDPVLKSYVKSIAASSLLAVLALLLASIAQNWLPSWASQIVDVLAILAMLIGATFACAGVVAVIRHQRAMRGDIDLYLQLNQSREASAIAVSRPPTVSSARRWWARRLLGHDFIVGDVVEVKSWSEVKMTLDETGRLENLPFMPEMRAMCGQRARVFRAMHRLFDYRKTRRMRHMVGTVLLVGTTCDGSSHGGCEAACFPIWKSAWLRRVDASDSTTVSAEARLQPGLPQDDSPLAMNPQKPQYTCQLTELSAASLPLSAWSAVPNLLRPLVSGNVAPLAFIVGWLTYLFNDLQHLRGGVGFPTFGQALPASDEIEETKFHVGDEVVVRSPAEIRATLNERMLNRGLWFEVDMLKHCGRRYQVQTDVRKLIDIVTGEMRIMKTRAYLLRDVNFSGERQLFNAQHDAFFWRGVWLRPYKTNARAD